MFLWLALLPLLVSSSTRFGICEDQSFAVRAEGVTIEAAFSYSVHGLIVTFEDRSAGVIIAWDWSFGDGTAQVSHVKSPTYEYMASGKYIVTLRITDESGLQDQVSRTVRLGSTDTRTLSMGAGTIILVIGLLFLFRGEGNVKLAGLVVIPVGLAFLVSLVTERDIIGRLLDLFHGWRI